jgi:hypothetical protein
VFARNRLAEPVKILLHELAVFEKHPRALDRRSVAPRREGRVRGFDGCIDFRRTARRALGDDVARGGVIDGRAGNIRLQPFAVDEEGAGSQGSDE